MARLLPSGLRIPAGSKRGSWWFDGKEVDSTCPSRLDAQQRDGCSGAGHLTLSKVLVLTIRSGDASAQLGVVTLQRVAFYTKHKRIASENHPFTVVL